MRLGTTGRDWGRGSPDFDASLPVVHGGASTGGRWRNCGGRVVGGDDHVHLCSGKEGSR